MKRKEVSVDGLSMRWEESGEGIPIVMIHGIPTSSALWRHVIPKVRSGRCLAWNMIGYGEAIEEGNGSISVARQAEHMAAWLRRIGVDKAILAGHDLGGGVAQITAVRHPNLCSGLFLTNAIGYDSWPIPSVKAMRASSALVRHFPDPLFKQVFRTFLVRGHSDSKNAKEALDVHWPHYAGHEGAADFVRQVKSLDVRDTLSVAEELPRLGVPARIAWGADDQFQKVEYGERFAQDLRAPLRRIAGGKHFTPEDYPEIIAEEINALLEEVRAREASVENHDEGAR